MDRQAQAEEGCRTAGERHLFPLLLGAVYPGPLAREAIAMGARPAIRLTLRESDDVEGDLGLLRSLVDLVRAYPGQDPFLLVVVTLAGERCPLLWRVRACPELRFLLASLMLARAAPRPSRGRRGPAPPAGG